MRSLLWQVAVSDDDEGEGEGEEQEGEGEGDEDDEDDDDDDDGEGDGDDDDDEEEEEEGEFPGWEIKRLSNIIQHYRTWLAVGMEPGTMMLMEPTDGEKAYRVIRYGILAGILTHDRTLLAPVWV